MNGEPTRPPRLAEGLLRALLPRDERDEVLGDLAEHHAHLVRTRGRRAAHRWYRRQAVTAPLLMWTGRRGGRTMPRPDLNELRLALRRFAREPGFTLITVLTLALGIGATTAVYSVVDGVLLEPLPYHQPDRIVSVAHTAPGLDLPRIPSATGLHVVYEERARSFSELALYASRRGTLVDGGDPERLWGATVTPSLFRVLRVDAAMGRTFTEDEGRPGSPQTLVLSHGLWTDRFGADPGILGRTLEVEGVSREVVGIMPPDFAFPRPDTRYWFPLQIDRTETESFGGFNFSGLGRLSEGTSPAAAARELEPLLHEAADRYASLSHQLLESGRIEPLVHPFVDDVVGDVRTALWILLATVGFVLLIACANVANLTLVRAEGRQREVAVRTALGAGRAHHATRFLTESALLVLAGSGVGLALAWQGLAVVRRLRPQGLPRIESIDLDGSVLAVALLLTAGAALVFGALPLLHYGGAGSSTTLREGARGSTGSRSRHRVRHLLVVSQVAFALILLVGSGLMARSFQSLLAVDTGFEGESVLTFQVSLPPRSYPSPDDLTAFHQELIRSLEALPGAQAAGLVSQLPLSGLSNMTPFTARHDLARPDESRPFVQVRTATPGYFRALGIPLIRGRGLAAADADDAASVALVSERVRELYFGELEPLGRQMADGVRTAADGVRWLEVVGVVGDVHYVSLTREPSGVVYLPIRVRERDAWMVRSSSYVIRSAADPTSLVPAVRDAVRRLDPELALADVRTMADLEARARSRTSFTMFMLLVASGVGLILGAVGLYGVLSYVTAHRTREIGVRMALGAEGATVRGMVMRQGLAVTAVGLVLGLAGAWTLSRFMDGLLFGVSATDPLTYGTVTVVLLGVSALAVFLPARKASRVDVVEALRAD